MPELSDGLGPIHSREPLQRQYTHVLKMDRKMRELVRRIPPILLREEPVAHATSFSWVTIARRSLAITAADKVEYPY